MPREFTPEFKVQVVLETFQHDTTLEAVGRKHNIVRSLLHKWRTEFKEHAASIFTSKRNPANRARAEGFEPGQSPDDLKKIIGELTVQNEILKKAEGLWGSGQGRR